MRGSNNLPVRKLILCGSYRKDKNQLNQLIQEFKSSEIEVLLPEGVEQFEDENILSIQNFFTDAVLNTDFIYVHNPTGFVDEENMHIIEKAIEGGHTAYFLEQPDDTMLKTWTQKFYDQSMIIAPDLFVLLIKHENDVWKQRTFFAECKPITKNE